MLWTLTLDYFALCNHVFVVCSKVYNLEIVVCICLIIYLCWVDQRSKIIVNYLNINTYIMKEYYFIVLLVYKLSSVFIGILIKLRLNKFSNKLKKIIFKKLNGIDSCRQELNLFISHAYRNRTDNFWGPSAWTQLFLTILSYVLTQIAESWAFEIT